MSATVRSRAALVFFATALAVFAAAPALASATTYYAKGGAGGSTCSQGVPCSLPTAVTNANTDGDAVVLEAGPTFNPGSILNVTHNIDIGGEPGSMPTVQGSSAVSNVFSLQTSGGAGATLHDVHLVQSGANVALREVNGTAERVLVTVSGERGCDISGGLLRDSVCYSSDGDGLIVITPISAGTFTPSIANVTAVGGAAGRGIDVLADSGTGEIIALSAVNVIARGGLGDVRTDTGNTVMPVSATLSHSNYAAADTSTGGTITAPGTNGNQTAAPQFANLLAGDFHQLSSSPTVNAGTADPLIGSQDLERNLRSQAGCIGGPPIPDIGAYELAPPVPSCSEFSFGKLKRNKHKGTATLSVTLPGAGVLSLGGHGVVKQRVTSRLVGPLQKAVAGPGTVTLKIKAKGKAKRKLKRRGHRKLKLNVTFAGTGVAASSETRRVKLVKKSR